jgi:cyanophycin synthetase
VGIVTNVAEDHIGLKDIETVEDMAKVKAVVAESVKPGGYAVLNADNDFTYQMRSRLKCQVALFSTNPVNERILQHNANGGLSGVLENGNIVLIRNRKKLFIESVENIPMAFGGNAIFMVENILASVLAAYVQNIPVLNISQALRSFIPSAENSPGRLNIFEFSNFRLMIDYAHNYHGIKALGQLIGAYDASSKTGIISVAGDRRDKDIINVGRASAEIFDRIIIRIDDDKRGRKESEIISLLMEGVKSINPDISVEIIPEELEAIHHAVIAAVPGSFIVHLSEKVKNCIAFAKKLQEDESIHTGELIFERITRSSEKVSAFRQYESTVD